MYETQSVGRTFYLQGRLHNLHMEEGSLVKDLIHNIKEITTFWVVVGELIPNKMNVNIMLNVLPPSYENLVVNIFGQVLAIREGLIERLLNEKQQKEAKFENIMNKALMMNNYGKGHGSYEKNFNHQPPLGQGGSSGRSNNVLNNNQINSNFGFYHKCESEKHW